MDRSNMSSKDSIGIACLLTDWAILNLLLFKLRSSDENEGTNFTQYSVHGCCWYPLRIIMCLGYWSLQNM
ncbi:hypothetical protein BJ875DRAFT_452684 [Amylocarpus encephaloides]|uniref:Uncharacterized protein n=1 Tax=Amylocarpus encephaloides TaxID=45428 RepID=A0A9P8CA84_9HELO|nr:hypothetical protein BJ875DRAFT_452684 [Amylocarpus encephaloides]